MKLKLLFGALVFTAFTAQAQLASINEDFNNFTEGNTTFPQNGWSAVIATNPMPYPPAPMMIVTTGTDKAVQSYAGNNATSPSYLISPQIIAPAGDKTLTFSTGLVATSPGSSTIQIGLASNPADMATFTPVGNAIAVSSTTIQSYTVNIPASTASYLVFRVTPTAAHTATLIDNVVYDVAPLATINESFNTFTSGPNALPQNGWNKVTATSSYNVYIATNNSSNAIQFYAANTPNTTSYLVSPKIVAPDGTKKVRFTTGISTSANGSATLEFGMVSNPADMTTFTSLANPITITTSSTTPETYTFDVPSSTSQYLVWKFTGAANHSAVYVDDVIYNVLTSLATSEVKNKTNEIQFAINSNQELQFVGKSEAKAVTIFSAAGSLALKGEVKNNRFNINTLQTGVYYILIQTQDGKIQKSKFIKP